MPVNLEAGPLMPPLDRMLTLSDELLARIVLAMKVWGAEWRQAAGEWWLRQPTQLGGYRTLLALWGEGRRTVTDDLPDPFTDPAAAWDLMVQEGMWVEPIYDELGGVVVAWEACWRDGYGYGRGPQLRNPLDAVVSAALHKHEEDPALAPLIRPLLARMEAAHANP